MRSSLYDLIANREDNFTDLDENNKEGIFEIQFINDQNKGGTGNDASMAFGFNVLSLCSEWYEVGEMVRHVAGW